MGSRCNIRIMFILFILFLSLVIQTSNQFSNKVSSPWYKGLEQGTNTDTGSFSPLLRLGIIRADKASYNDEFGYFAAIPLFVFNNGTERQYRGPLLFTNGDLSSEYFLEDWYKYAVQTGKQYQTIGIGEFSSYEKEWFEQNSNTIMQHIIHPLDPYTLAVQLSKYDWDNSSTVVLTPAFENPSNTSISTEEIQLQFESASSRTFSTTGNIGDGNWSNHTLTLSASDGFVNGTISWSPSYPQEAITHYVIDPDNQIRDYSSNTYSYVQSYMYQKPLFTRFLVREEGDWKIAVYGKNLFQNKEYTVDLSVHPASFRDIEVPNNTIELNVSISWTQAGKQIDLVLFNPDGEAITTSTKDNVLNSQTNEFISIRNPQAGTWTLSAILFDATNEDLSLHGSIALETQESSFSKILQSAANGASLAAIKNAPL
ncbi:MAG: pre-peptidase C-terminal domain-containing protein, partial [Candidatus Ranarchaeia archaeon]